MSKRRVAVYLRVSTGEQSVESQRRELMMYLARRGWAQFREFVDTCSGAKSSRQSLDELMTEVRAGRVDVVVCYKLDRLGRSLTHLAQVFGELERSRVGLVVPSQGIDTSEDNPSARLQLHILSAVAEFERSIIRDRTRTGLANARAKGKLLGKPRALAKRQKLIDALERNPEAKLPELQKASGLSAGSCSQIRKQWRLEQKGEFVDV
ncbi:recombinase family protein [Cerasicoccus frondis]|uniref:recombinase family protein n=1 Tax=Cerasicoccus frondis TaxID=490090 RepID=UPI0028524B54|nr:recombinase family protein [Cerasicoccus frondis]